MLLYRILSIILFPVLELYLFYRVYKKKENKWRLRERFGHATVVRPQGDVIWVHAVSVGETNSVLILIEELLKTVPEKSILFTSTTLTSAKIISDKISHFNGQVMHQFLPIDSYHCVQNFLDFWQPSAVIFVESEIWPNLIDGAVKRDIPTFLVNARMSEKSASKWHMALSMGFNIFDCFDAIFAQSQEDQERFQSLTEKKVLCLGNLKSQAQNLVCNEVELSKLKAQIGGRKCWIAASTHKGEEMIALQVHSDLKKEFPDLLTIIVPRHPNRAEEIKELIGEVNFSQRSQGQDIEESTEIYLADTLGELGTFYNLTNFVFIGGSLAEVGGHNPFEAIKLECAVISGPHVFNFKEIYAKLSSENGCVIVESKDQLAAKVREFLTNQYLSRDVADKAFATIQDSGNIAGNLVKAMGF